MRLPLGYSRDRSEHQQGDRDEPGEHEATRFPRRRYSTERFSTVRPASAFRRARLTGVFLSHRASMHLSHGASPGPTRAGANLRVIARGTSACGASLTR